LPDVPLEFHVHASTIGCDQQRGDKTRQSEKQQQDDRVVQLISSGVLSQQTDAIDDTDIQEWNGHGDGGMDQ